MSTSSVAEEPPLRGAAYDEAPALPRFDAAAVLVTGVSHFACANAAEYAGMEGEVVDTPPPGAAGFASAIPTPAVAAEAKTDLDALAGGVPAAPLLAAVALLAAEALSVACSIT